MPEEGPPPTVFHILERSIGRRILAILDSAYGFEGTLAAVNREPPGIWLSDADAIILRSTIAKPIPQIVSKEERSEVFINMSSVQRIEVLHKSS